jgi:hypothetical protein
MRFNPNQRVDGGSSWSAGRSVGQSGKESKREGLILILLLLGVAVECDELRDHDGEGDDQHDEEDEHVPVLELERAVLEHPFAVREEEVRATGGEAGGKKGEKNVRCKIGTASSSMDEAR